MKNRAPSTLRFITLMNDENTRQLMLKAIEQGRVQNPDPITNPVSNLEELYDYLDWAVACLPWEIYSGKTYQNLYLDINQAINFFWFLFGQKLKALEPYHYYLPTLEYHEPIASWIRDYANSWGDFLNTEASWNDTYFQKHFEDDLFGMNSGWYSRTNIWKNYNEFFSRHLIDPSVRPIAESEVVFPADSAPEGVWNIDAEGYVDSELTVKAHPLYNVNDILGSDSAYRNAFNGGTLTHTFLNVFDYHRYHFPIDGTILEMKKIKGVNAVGGHTSYNPEKKLYQLDCSDTDWQIIETRDSIILDTEFGLVAVLPIGMSQICSCNFEENLTVGKTVKRGDPLGYFLFGGSDIVMLFQKDVKVTPCFEVRKHGLMGQAYATLEKK